MVRYLIYLRQSLFSVLVSFDAVQERLPSQLNFLLQRLRYANRLAQLVFTSTRARTSTMIAAQNIPFGNLLA